METRYLFHNRKERRAVWAQRPGTMQAPEGTPPNPHSWGRNEPPLAPVSLASAWFHRTWQEPQCELPQSQNFFPAYEIQYDTVKHILKICCFSQKINWRWSPPSPMQWREALCTVYNTPKHLLQTKHFPHKASQPKTCRTPRYSFPSERTVLTGKIRVLILWLGKTLT